MGKRIDELLNSHLPGPCACEEVDARRLIDEAVEAALTDAADHFLQRDGATYVLEELLRLREQVVAPSRAGEGNE